MTVTTGTIDVAVTETIGVGEDHASLHDAMVSLGNRRLVSGGLLTERWNIVDMALSIGTPSKHYDRSF